MRTQSDQRSSDAGREFSGQGGDLRAVGDQLRALRVMGANMRADVVDAGRAPEVLAG
jgi:hypothetical protein